MSPRHALVLAACLLGCAKDPRAEAEPPAPRTPAAPVSPAPTTAPPPASAAPAPQVDAMSTPPLAVELTAAPAKLTLATRAQLRLTVTVKNLGTATLDPELNLSTLAVDGTAAKAWNLALANSGRPKKWKELPGGDSVSGAVAGIGEELFPKPGDYTVVLTVSGVAAAPLAITVTK